MSQSSIKRKDAAGLVKKVTGVKRELDIQWDAFGEISECVAESKLGRAVWEPVEVMIDLLADHLGDDTGIVNWFFWDNDCGKQGLQHSLPNGKLVEVKTVGNLLDVLGF